VNGFGYGDRQIVKAIKKQVDTLMHTSNLFHTEPASALAERLVKLAFPSKVFFTNSGTEAFEGAMKFARRIGKQQGRTEYVAFENSFHGERWARCRSPGPPSTASPSSRSSRACASCRAATSPRWLRPSGRQTAAVMLEPVQGEGGVRPARPSS
jgi:acetylornithine/succinyldiaminopimelate/putrescine aminotransferase